MALNEDTIFAPATALGGAIAVIRISGPRAADAVALLSLDVTRTPRRRAAFFLLRARTGPAFRTPEKDLVVLLYNKRRRFAIYLNFCYNSFHK